MESGARGCAPFVLAGLRLLPWLQEAYRSDKQSVEHFFDCQSCMASVDAKTRQYMGCGYEPVDPAIPVGPWNHRGRQRPKDEPLVCPGFACGLPEVIEASDAHMFWSKGQLTEHCDGKAATHALRFAIKVLETENAKVQAWTVAEQERKAQG